MNITVDERKFNRLLKKMIETEPLHYKELTDKPKLRKDGGRKRSGRKAVRKPDKN